MVKVNHITHKKSNIADKAPKATDIANGEIAVNYADDTERMYIKNTSGEIIPFSSDHIIKDYVDKSDSIIINIINDIAHRTMAKGYDTDNATLANIYGSKDLLNMVLRHYKMGLFKNGALVKECAPCRITKAVDGSDINIDGSEGDIMLYTDVPIYRDRCRVSGMTVLNSSATTHNMIGLGLTPHQVGGKIAKKMNPFAFTPGYVQFDGKEYRSCYNTTYKGGGNSGVTPPPIYTTNFIGENGAQGGYPVMGQSAIDNMQRSRAKGDKYQGIFYEFYEMWLIAMYLELGSLYFTGTDSFGAGCSFNTLSAEDWISGGSSGIRIKDEKGDGTDYYGGLVRTTFKTSENSGIEPLEGLLGRNKQNFEEALESQRFVDALVKSNLADKVDGVTVLEYDDNKNGYVKVSSNVDVASGSGMTEGKKYYIIRNVPNCQGIGDGVMTYVLNVFVKTRFNSDVYHDKVDVGGKTVIFKFSYPTYRGLELLSGGFTQIEGINYISSKCKDSYSYTAWKTSIWYAKDYTDIKYDPINHKPTDADYSVSTDTLDEDIPYIKGFVKGCEYIGYNYYEWIKHVNYDVSLYCVTECSGGASVSSYECGYTTGVRSSNNGEKYVGDMAVGCGYMNLMRGRSCQNSSVKVRDGGVSGGFSIGNPSL